LEVTSSWWWLHFHPIFPELSENEFKFNGKKFFRSKKAEETLSSYSSVIKKNLGAFWKLVVAPFSSYIQNSVKISSNLTGKNSLDLKKLKKHFRVKVPSSKKIWEHSGSWRWLHFHLISRTQ
jgi:hypothetical protein